MLPQGRADQRLRLFVAVDLPEEVRQTLGRLQAELKRWDLTSLRWTRPESTHLTLKFLGEVPAPSVPSIEAALAGAVDGGGAFRLALGRLSTFGNRRGPRVLWLGIEGDVARLMGLQAAVEEAMARLGFDREEQGFSPHLTLARVRQPARPETGRGISEALEAIPPPSGEFDVTEVALMRSMLGPGGAKYERLATFPLG